MLVTVKGFGGIWERRFGTSTARSKRFAQAAFYNTTGVLVSGKVRYRWRIGGKIRFNGVRGFTCDRHVAKPCSSAKIGNYWQVGRKSFKEC